MSTTEELRKKIQSAETATTYEEAYSALHAYIELDKAGSDELEMLLFEYARGSIKNHYLTESLKDILYIEEDLLLRLAKYKKMFETIAHYKEASLIPQEITQQEATKETSILHLNDFINEAQTNLTQQKYEEALKYTSEALKIISTEQNNKQNSQIICQIINDIIKHSVKIFVDNIEIPLKSFYGSYIADVNKTGEMIIKLGNKIILSKKLDRTHIYNIDDNFSHEFLHRKTKSSTVYSSNHFTIELQKGNKAGKLIIKIKK
jgi:tetratricopeptide (TPR) repeat protein